MAPRIESYVDTSALIAFLDRSVGLTGAKLVIHNG
jgi:hypothetical protein